MKKLDKIFNKFGFIIMMITFLSLIIPLFNYMDGLLFGLIFTLLIGSPCILALQLFGMGKQTILMNIINILLCVILMSIGTLLVLDIKSKHQQYEEITDFRNAGRTAFIRIGYNFSE